LDPLQFVARSLCVGIEMADGLDVPVQHVDPIGIIRTHGKHVEQRTAYRELAVRHHLGHGGISRQHQARAQRRKIERFAHMHLE
jgi:hypothetical protein